MDNILEKLAKFSKMRVFEDIQKISRENMKVLAKKSVGEEKFLAALQKKNLSFICEVKKASPRRKELLLKIFLTSKLRRTMKILARIVFLA